MFKRNAILIVLFTMLAVTLFSQTAEKSKSLPDQVKSSSEQLLKLLYDNDWKASDWIDWDEFNLNGNYLGTDYREAFEYYEEDYFMEDTIEQISRLLQSEGGSKDSFKKFNVENKGLVYTVTTSNPHKKVIMQLKKYDGNQFLLIKLDVTDNK
jgi:hypothetical protein